MQKTVPIISAAEVGRLMENKAVVLIDARTGADALDKYNAEHLDGARYVDLEKDLSLKSPDAAKGGRHPLPPAKDFAFMLGKLGIDASSHVVVYDDKSGANAAARFWWMLKALGHKNVQVLDGGLGSAIKAGLPITDKIPGFKTQPPYPADKWILPTTNADEVARAVMDPNHLVVDVRESFRYRGENEPIDLVAGHIPGAINIPYTENLDSNGHFRSGEELNKKYTDALAGRDPQQVIVHCGSGVTACHTILAMEHAGFEIPVLYVGSWSEWSRNARPVAVDEGLN